MFPLLISTKDVNTGSKIIRKRSGISDGGIENTDRVVYLSVVYITGTFALHTPAEYTDRKNPNIHGKS